MPLSDSSLRRLGWLCLAFFGLTLVVDLAVNAIAQNTFNDWGDAGAFGAFAFLSMTTLFPVVAQLIIRQRPRNRIGWLLHAVGLGWAAANVGDAYVLTAFSIRPGDLPGAGVAEVLNSALWVAPIVLMGVFVPLLFPDGRPPSVRWRLLAWLAGVDAMLVVLGIVFRPGPLTDVLVPLDANPIGIGPAEVAVKTVLLVSELLLPIFIWMAAAAMIMRFRRASGVERLQLKWLMAAAATVAVLFALAMTVGGVSESGGTTPGWQLNLESLAILCFGLLPVAIGIAITRHGLYGIDALISRALTVAVLGAFITAVYVGIVAGIGTLIGQRRPSVALSIIATGLVAVAFQPVRERVHRWVNRLVYGERATPYEVLSHFAVEMAGRYTTGELLPRLAQTLSASLGGARVTIWLRTDSGLTCRGAWPVAAGEPDADRRLESPDEDPLAALRADRIVPVRHRGELLGAIAATKPARDPFASAEAALLEHVSSQAGLVLRNLRLVEDLQASRRRLVTAQDDERRRLERDLHDGAQQSLVAVSIMVQVAVDQTERDARAASIATASEQLRTAIAALRELAHGIHPAVLTERGLRPAVQSLATRCPVPVEVDSNLDRRLPAPVESTLYFLVAEGLTNVAKYAGARHVLVTIRDDGGHVTVGVQDDGVGGAEVGAGSGLVGLADRLAVVDGDLSVSSPPGGGTRLTGRAPVPPPTESKPAAPPLKAPASLTPVAGG